MPDFVLQRLEPDSPRKPFDCGDPDLNEFFLNDSIDHSRQLLAVTYALESEDETVAYFSVPCGNPERLVYVHPEVYKSQTCNGVSACLPVGRDEY